MKRTFIFAVLLGFFGFTATAQNKISYHGQHYAGLLEGEQGSSFQFQTINGIRKGLLFAGLGTGVDYYYLRSIPVFLSFTHYLTDRPRGFFLSADLGTNRAWRKGPMDPFLVSQKYRSGLYWGASMGFRASFRNKKDAILLSLGYSYKQLREERVTPTFCINPPCPNFTENFNYQTKRVSVRLGWAFGN